MRQKEAKNDVSNEIVYGLKDFIDDYHKLMAVMGVFLALGLFWSNSPIHELKSYASFLCFLVTLLLFFEVLKGAINRNASLNLSLFILVLILIFYRMVLFVFVFYEEARKYFLRSLIAVSFSLLIYELIIRRKFLRLIKEDLAMMADAKELYKTDLKELENEDIRIGLSYRRKYIRESIALLKYSPFAAVVLLIGLALFISGISNAIADALVPYLDSYLDSIRQSYNQ